MFCHPFAELYLCHCKVGAGLPVTWTPNDAEAGAVTVVLEGWVMKEGGTLTSFTRMLPVFPTAQPMPELGKWTPFRMAVTPLPCKVQLAPPLVVLTMTPFSPVAQPVLAFTK